MALIKCTECGAEISDKAQSCPNCGMPQGNNAVSEPCRFTQNQGYAPQQAAPVQNQPVVVVKHQSNGLGTAGFVLSLISLFLCLIPFVGWAVWFLGFLFSFIGLFRRPRGLAIAGFILSFLDVIILLFWVGIIAGAFSGTLSNGFQ